MLRPQQVYKNLEERNLLKKSKFSKLSAQGVDIGLSRPSFEISIYSDNVVSEILKDIRNTIKKRYITGKLDNN